MRRVKPPRDRPPAPPPVAGRLALLLLVSLTACAGRATLQRSVADLYAGHTEAADATLARYGERVGSNDCPLYLLDAAVVKQLRGDYAASNRLLAEADRRVEAAVTKSVSRETLSFLVNDQTRPYVGLPFERPLIPYYKALNYLLLGQPDEAAVEARRLDLRLQAVGRYLKGRELAREVGYLRHFAGIVYEAAGEENDAMVSYRLALARYREGGGPPADLVAAALRLSRRLGLLDEAAALAARHPGIAPAPEGAELVVVVHTGRIPHRITESLLVPGGRGFPVRLSLPALTDGSSGPKRITVHTPGGTTAIAPALNLAAAARADLMAARGRDMARLVARAVAKEVAARKARRDGGEVAGLLVRAVNIATEVADTRSWEALPATLYLARLPLSPGSATVEVSAGGRPVARRELVVERGKFYLVKVRLF